VSADLWLSRSSKVVDDAGAVLRGWRLATGRTQADVADALGTTQQHLSQMENGRRPVTLEQRRLMVTELGIAAEDLGLSSGQAHNLVSPDSASPEIAASRVRWRAERRWLNQHRAELARLAARLYPADCQIPRTPLIAAPAWRLAEPVDLGALTLELDEGPQAVLVAGDEPESAGTRPLRTATARFDRYTSAVKHLNPPTLFESRPSYRLLRARLDAGALRFGLAAYFDKLDVSEAVGHELAAVCMNSGIPSDVTALLGLLPFRELIGDPFELARRAVIPAITTLTIRLRRYPAEPSFLLHWRDPAKVATASGMYDVIPSGEFQPSSVALWDRRNDFDLWRNIVREYAEEFLGEPEHDGTRSHPIAYDEWPLYEKLDQARRHGAVTAHVLGVGLDALTLAATILAVVVIDDEVFSEVFGRTVQFNDEGEIVTVGGGTPAEGVPLSETAVTRLLDTEPMSSGGAACLALAWQHRRLLGL
jgi:transcriptional regulator with XRE-family HTH domain